MSSITYVTAFIDINQNTQNKSIDWRFDNFCDLARSGINLCVYIDTKWFDRLQTIANIYPNVKIMKMVNLQDTFVSKTCSQIKYTLPSVRNEEKDTADYMMLINSKYEFTKDAIQQNVWNTTHFAWIDFSIFYIFKNKELSAAGLRSLSNDKLASKFFAIPGCWNKQTTNSPQSVNWRFCGGFFIGDKNSVMDFCELCERKFPEYIRSMKCLSWEVNFWAWLETMHKWSPTWYSADHNDRILYVPASFYATQLNKNASFKKTTYSYPKIDSIYDPYTPSSAAYLRFKDQHILNTRFINYRLSDSGHYTFNHPEQLIITKNMRSILHPDTFEPQKHAEMQDKTVHLQKTQYPDDNMCKIYGLEDIRLYEYNDKVRFIATNRNYSPHINVNRMIVGDYDVESMAYLNCRVVEPPQYTWCEKNWIPLVKANDKAKDNDKDKAYDKDKDKANDNDNDKANDNDKDEEYFIYKWSPMEIGQIDPTNNTLRIVKTHMNTVNVPDFRRVRGSTVFIELEVRSQEGLERNELEWNEDTSRSSMTKPQRRAHSAVEGSLVGVVHFSEEKSPREYFHILVTLDKDTFCPIRYSRTFCFQKVGIEFCTGFCIKDNRYVFWISSMDREPEMISIDMEDLPLCNVF